MGRKVTIKRGKDKTQAVRRVSRRLIVALVVVSVIFIAYKLATSHRSQLARVQSGVAFTVTFPDPMPPGFTLEEVTYLPEGVPRDKVTEVVMRFMSGPDQMIIRQQPADRAGPLPTVDRWGKTLHVEMVGPYQVVEQPGREGMTVSFDYMITRVSISSPTLSSRTLKQVVEVMSTKY